MTPQVSLLGYMPFVLRLVLLGVFIVLLIAIIAYARGYRFSMKDRLVVPSGILAVSSSPKAAKVYVNGELKGVTDLNLTLPADQYTVEVKKDGYTDWKQDVTLKGEIVLTLDAALFPKNPSLSPLTNLGIIKAIPVDQTDNVMIFTQNNDPLKDGIYIFDANKKPLSFFPPLRLLALKQNFPIDVDFSKSTIYFDPDFKQSIVEFSTATNNYAYLFSLDAENVMPFDVTTSENAILDAWNTQKNLELVKILETFPREIRPIASDSFHIISISPDKTKMLYEAKYPATLPRVIIPPLIGSNQTQEERDLQANNLYLYDKKEDKNFHLPFEFQKLQKILETAQNLPAPTLTLTPTPPIGISPTQEISTLALSEISPILWYSDSKHLGILQEHEIVVIDYDGTNRRTVYAGPFQKDFFLVTTDDRLFVLTNLNSQYNQFPDIYEVGTK